MASVRELANITGYSRDAINMRVKRWGLGSNPDPKRILQLIPLDQDHEERLSLEQQRTEESRENTRLKKLAADKLEAKLADVDELMAAENELFSGILAIIKTSELSEDRKEDIYSAFREHTRTWRDGLG